MTNIKKIANQPSIEINVKTNNIKIAIDNLPLKSSISKTARSLQSQALEVLSENRKPRILENEVSEGLLRLLLDPKNNTAKKIANQLVSRYKDKTGIIEELKIRIQKADMMLAWIKSPDFKRMESAGKLPGNQYGQVTKLGLSETYNTMKNHSKLVLQVLENPLAPRILPKH